MYKAASRLLLLRSSHSQMRITFQPRAIKARIVSSSRSMFRVILASQNGVLLLGNLKYLHPSWPCQKQPSTNMTVLYFFNTISGEPGSFLLFRRYRSPLLNKNFRTKISGLVSLPLIAAMQRLRCSGVKTSAMYFKLIISTNSSYIGINSQLVSLAIYQITYDMQQYSFVFL